MHTCLFSKVLANMRSAAPAHKDIGVALYSLEAFRSLFALHSLTMIVWNLAYWIRVCAENTLSGSWPLLAPNNRGTLAEYGGTII